MVYVTRFFNKDKKPTLHYFASEKQFVVYYAKGFTRQLAIKMVHESADRSYVALRAEGESSGAFAQRAFSAQEKEKNAFAMEDYLCIRRVHGKTQLD